MTTRSLDPEEIAVALAPAFAAGVERPTPALLDAWRQAHHAAQLASEVGKAWAPPCDDDSHSSFAWRAGALHGVPTAARAVHAALRVAPLELALLDAADAPLAVRALGGATFAEAMAWVRAEAERLVGPPRQAARPAPGLPAHPVADGAPFRATAAGVPLARLLSQADTILRHVAAVLGADPPRCWPHHFDLATLVPVVPEAGSRTARTIPAILGLGLAVPDGFAASGYWYASPWRGPTAASWPALPHGHWAARDGGPPLGVLPLDALASRAPREAAAALAGFLSATVAAAAAAA